MTFQEITNEGNQTVETSDNTSAEILELKKSIVEEFVKKNFDSSSSFKKWIIKNYLVDKKSRLDKFFDRFIIWGLWKVFWLLPKDIEKYREIFSEADTKNKLEELRKSIFNDAWWTERSTDTDESCPPSENSETVDNSWVVKKACQIAVDIANDNSYWYEWGATGNKNGRKWFDCQSFVRHCYIKTWINVPPSWWCGTMKRDFEKVWFECITFNKNAALKPWDILVDPKKHTEMCVWENKIAWAHSNKDKKAWDSGWEEISVRSVKSSLSYWNPQFILRYKWSAT